MILSKFGQQIDTQEKAYLAAMHEILMEHKFGHQHAEYLESSQFQSDLTEEQYRRVDRFHDCLVPWLRRVHSLENANVFEVGSGTGSSTLAFAPYVDRVHCFEIDDRATRIAGKRLDFWGIDNVTFEESLFVEDATVVRATDSVDLVLLVAVLEHVYFQEFKAIVRLAYEKLRPGGVILIAETPNRLSIQDFHTSWINFFQWLPPEVAREYYTYSPRAQFVHDIGESHRLHGKDTPQAIERAVRWGRGVSYHDFELALGPAVHDMIVLDGWEDEVRPLAPVFEDDEVLVDIFQRFGVPANKAFARSWLYFCLRKPDGA